MQLGREASERVGVRARSRWRCRSAGLGGCGANTRAHGGGSRSACSRCTDAWQHGSRQAPAAGVESVEPAAVAVAPLGMHASHQQAARGGGLAIVEPHVVCSPAGGGAGKGQAAGGPQRRRHACPLGRRTAAWCGRCVACGALAAPQPNKKPLQSCIACETTPSSPPPSSPTPCSSGVVASTRPTAPVPTSTVTMSRSRAAGGTGRAQAGTGGVEQDGSARGSAPAAPVPCGVRPSMHTTADMAVPASRVLGSLVRAMVPTGTSSCSVRWPPPAASCTWICLRLMSTKNRRPVRSSQVGDSPRSQPEAQASSHAAGSACRQRRRWRQAAAVAASGGGGGWRRRWRQAQH